MVLRARNGDADEEVAWQPSAAESKKAECSMRTMAVAMMQEFEWTIKTAMEEAELAQNAAELAIDPAIERRERFNARIVRPSAKVSEAPSARLLHHGRVHAVGGEGVELADQEGAV